MKRIIWAILAMFTLATAVAQLATPKSLYVRQYLDEQATRNRLLSENRTEALKTLSTEFAPPQIINGVEMVDAFIGIDDANVIPVLESWGVIVNSKFDGFVTALIPLHRLSRVEDIPGVNDIQMSRMLELCTDSTLSQTLAGQVLNGTDFGLPQAYDGTGIIVGIIDFGFDYQHYAFRDSEDPSKTRIVRVYDANDSTGHPVIVNGNTMMGSVFMGDEISTLKTDYYGGTHGTHTASIATGRHFNGYGGMAPGAEIILAVPRFLSITVRESEIVNCMKYIYAYADSVNKPCVISLSVSTSYGPHDGNDYMSKAIAQCVGPGRIFVIAAGNNGVSQDYCGGSALHDKPFNMLVGCKNANPKADDSYYYDGIWVDTWVRRKSTRPVARFHILDKVTKRIVWESRNIASIDTIYADEISDYFEPNLSKDSIGRLNAIISYSGNNGKYDMKTFIYNLRCKSYTVDGSGYITSRYQIGISVYPPSHLSSLSPDSIYVDSWMGLSIGQRDWIDGVYIDKTINEDSVVTQYVQGFYAWPQNECSIGSYAVNDSIISAGAYVGRNNYYSLPLDSLIIDNSYVGGYTNFSSYQSPGAGPTGFALPTVVAPGYNVIAAGSRYSYFADYNPSLVARSEDGSYWGVLSGTSMAAPTVAGIIAQWLQINPELSPKNIKNILSETSRRDAFTDNPIYGVRYGAYGKIDAMAGAKFLLGIEDPVFKKGDVDGDGIVDINDVTLMIDYLLHLVDSLVVPKAGDVDGDEVIDINDVTTLIDYILGIIDLD